MKAFLESYFTHFKKAQDAVVVTRDEAPVPVDVAVMDICKLLDEVGRKRLKVMMAGNGGSAGICSHQAVDYWKNGGIRALAFNDASLLTCVSNDYSFEEVFSKPVEMFADAGDLMYCISSSGKSQNILNAADAARQKKCTVVTFSGFDENNPLRSRGAYNFYVPSFSYGAVEILHLFIIHAILDAYLHEVKKVDVFNRNAPRETA